MKYGWKDCAYLGGNANDVGAELERIQSKRGKLTPQIVVEEAKPKGSPLHRLIYDGTTADEALAKYRLFRAGHILRSIIVVEEGAKEVIVTRGFESVVVDGEREYMPVATAADDPEMREQVRGRYLRMLRTAKDGLRGFDEMADLVASVDTALERIAA